MPNHKELLQLLIKQDRSLSRIYSAMARELAVVLKKYKVHNNSKLWFKNAQVKKEVDALLNKYHKIVTNYISQKSTDAWQLSNTHNDNFVSSYIKGITVLNQALYFQRNTEALQSFLKRSSGGFTLSERVWNLTDQTRSQLNYFIAEGLTTGRSASSLAKDLKRYLKNPDKRFRRLRSSVTGKLITSDPAKNFKPGTGVYRSSYKNALRLARNEINIAYRTADFERRKQLPFVTGITVNLSPAHPKHDICDELIGDYPKDFIFTGWHPNCLCFTTSKLMPKDEFREFLKTRKSDNVEKTNTIPLSASRFLYLNSNKIKTTKSKPYFIKDNFVLGKDGYQIKKSIGVHVPYVEIPDLRLQYKGISEKYLKDYKIIFNQEDKYRSSMMKSFLERAKDISDSKLILEQKASIHGYTSNKVYEDLNNLLRGSKEFVRNPKYKEFLTSYANVLEHSLSKLPKFKGYVFRGTKLNESQIERYIKAYKNKKPLKELFFQSTSDDINKAFGGNVKFIIKSKTGKKIEHLSFYKNSEAEVLMNRDVNYNVYDVKINGNATEIYMDEI